MFKVSFQPIVNVSSIWDILISFLSTKLSKPDVCFLHLRSISFQTRHISGGLWLLYETEQVQVIRQLQPWSRRRHPSWTPPSLCLGRLLWRLPHGAHLETALLCFFLSWRPCFLDCGYSRFPLVVLLSHGGYAGQRRAVGVPTSWAPLAYL